MRIYLAGPYFNDRERDVADRLWSALTSEKHDVYFFAKNGIVLKPDSNQEDREKAFYGDISEIEECSLVIANIERDPEYGVDPGTVFEVGVAWNMDKLIIAYDETPDKRLNVMLAVACTGYARNIEELKSMLRGDVKKWTGKVE